MVIIAETERLIIRTWMPEEDAEQAFEIYGDPEVTQFMKSKANSVADQKELLQLWVAKAKEINNGTGLWANVLKETGEIIGTSILIQLPDNQGQLTETVEIGWHLKKAAWGKGYATEAAIAVLNYGFNTLQLTVVCSAINPQGNKSVRVAQRLGMVPVGKTTRFYETELEMFILEADTWRQATANLG